MHASQRPSIPAEADFTLYSFSPEQREVFQLHTVFIEVGMNKKYFSKKLRNAQHLNRWMDIALVATTVSILIASTRAYNQSSALGYVIFISVVSGLALCISMSKHFFRVTKNLETFSKLHQEYTSLFYNLRLLEDELWLEEKLTPCMRKELMHCRERITNIATEEDLVPNRKKLQQFQKEVEKETGYDQDRLFLPEGGEYEFDEEGSNETDETPTGETESSG